MPKEPDKYFSFEDGPSAEAVAELLRREGIPARVELQSPIPGLVEDVRVVVPEALEHRARWVLSSADVSDRELVFLATGELDGADDEET